MERLVYNLSKEQAYEFIRDYALNLEVFADKDLVVTVQTLMDCGGNLAQTARKLYVHRNTLNYRLDKIKRLTGLNVKKYEDATIFKLALLADRRIR
ncbi:transcriptional regulator, CdaR [Lachnospiraceae bacterium TWA4]|nr:transcriptional regulator, CdaR [Lachnospiraceae bacterium TWA4]